MLGIWKRFLTLQFHDIIPGSSIGKVYEEAEAEYKGLIDEIDNILTTNLTNLTNKEKSFTVFNDLSWERTELIKINNEYREVTVPPLGWMTLENKNSFASVVFYFTSNKLETPFYIIQFNDSAEITSLYDKRQNREYVAKHALFNAFVLAEDIPVNWDAWDIDADWKEHIIPDAIKLKKNEVSENGPLCFILKNQYRIGENSLLSQNIILYAHNPRIDFETHVEWHETHKLLKIAFDTSIFTQNVRCEVQYGHIIRNITQNLPQDRARFEICAHKWISLEETCCGIALLNDCKYGHDMAIEENGTTMRLSLLRSPKAPDPNADQGSHDFTYSLLPFTGIFEKSNVIQSAYELNCPLRVAGLTSNATSSNTDFSFCSVDNSAVVIEVVKLAKEPSSQVVMRLYESLGSHAKTTVRFCRDIKTAVLTDLLEDNAIPIHFKANELSLAFKPFEIKTIKIMIGDT
jgi:alpha-mannosidase